MPIRRRLQRMGMDEKVNLALSPWIYGNHPKHHIGMIGTIPISSGVLERQLVDRLDQQFALLAGTARDLPPHQQTLETTLDWSFDFLGSAERALFTRWSVFNGGFTLEAAESVCAGGVVVRGPADRPLPPPATEAQLAGYPIEGIKARLYDGSFHEVDSNELAFKMAGIFALKEATGG